MFANNVKHVFFDPDGLFAQRMDQMPLWHPAVLVFFVGVINTIPSLLISSRMDSGLSAAGDIVVGVTQLIGAVLGFLSVFVIWLIVTGFFHGVSALLGAEQGTFRRTFRLVGWGFLPSLFGGLLNVYSTWSVLRHLPASVPPQELQAQLQASPTVQVVTAVGLFLTVWQGLLWVYAVRHARGLSLRKSAAVVAAPVCLQLGTAVFGLL